MRKVGYFCLWCNHSHTMVWSILVIFARFKLVFSFFMILSKYWNAKSIKRILYNLISTSKWIFVFLIVLAPSYHGKWQHLINEVSSAICRYSLRSLRELSLKCVHALLKFKKHSSRFKPIKRKICLKTEKRY